MSDAANICPDPSARLEAAFREIDATRMRGLAFVNPAVRVEAIAFERWRHYWLGVLLTPWSMNLLLMPGDAAAWKSLAPGEKRRYRFPAGSFDFIGARDETFGEYLVCSLFSPVLEFADHDTAREVAKLARAALFDAANAETPEVTEGDPGAGHAAMLEREPHSSIPLGTTLERPMSRRSLLQGRLRPDVDEPTR